MELGCAMAGSAAAPPGPGPPAAAGAGLADSEEYESLPSGVALGTHMVAGAVAGIMEHTIMYPVDSVKTRMQSLQPDPKAQYRGVYEALRRMVLTEGFWRPLRGIDVTMLGAGPAHALYFACYEKMKKALSDVFQPGGNSHLANVVKQRLQMFNSPYTSVLGCVRTVHRTEGLGAFYRSYTTQLTMNVPFQAIHFITYELMQEHLNPHRQYHPQSHIVAGAVAGAVAAAATTPLDVCKTLLNTQENTALSSLKIRGHLSGMANAFSTVYQLGGLPGFFKGVQARVIYQMPSTAIAWSVYEFFKYFLTKRALEKKT
ncbi:mitoferrin-1 isoform X2 [Agelaius tricolor]|uniref:mitoferrin-1 isoform X2 n=1 Tax=Agelaius tricolor TaxID=9191 RepID=UPI0039F23FBB